MTRPPWFATSPPRNEVTAPAATGARPVANSLSAEVSHVGPLLPPGWPMLRQTSGSGRGSAQDAEWAVMFPGCCSGEVAWVCLCTSIMQSRLARLLASPAVAAETLDDIRARAAGQLCGATGTDDLIDASVVLGARGRGDRIFTSAPDDLLVSVGGPGVRCDGSLAGPITTSSSSAKAARPRASGRTPRPTRRRPRGTRR